MVPSAPSAGSPPAPAQRLVDLLQSLGVTHLVTVPDNTSAPILQVAETEAIRLLYATREGEAIALASGLWLGGALPAVLIQNTGFLEAGDALRGTASRMGAPLLLLVTCRGYGKARAAGMEPGEAEVDRDLLVREDLDSVAFMTEKTLRAWGTPYLTLVDPSDPSPVGQAFAKALEEGRPWAVLLDASFD